MHAVTYRQPDKPKPGPKSFSPLQRAAVFCTCNALVVGGIFAYLRVWWSVLVMVVALAFQLRLLYMARKNS